MILRRFKHYPTKQFWHAHETCHIAYEQLNSALLQRVDIGGCEFPALDRVTLSRMLQESPTMDVCVFKGISESTH
jgi:hypothetical protein